MALKIINIGTSPNKADGDPLRIAFEKINHNFAYLDRQVEIIDLTEGFNVTEDSMNKYYRIKSNEPSAVYLLGDSEMSTFPIGKSVAVVQAGEGPVTLVPVPGVTINSIDGALTTVAKFNTLVLTKIGPNKWDLFGSGGSPYPNWDDLDFGPIVVNVTNFYELMVLTLPAEFGGFTDPTELLVDSGSL